MILLESAKELFTTVMWSKETSEKLLDLKKELAEKYVQKLEKEKSDLFLSVGRDVVIDYLIDEKGIGDTFNDALVGKAMESFSSLSSNFKSFRERLNNATTEEDLQSLKNEVLAIESKQEDGNVSNPSVSEEVVQSSSHGEIVSSAATVGILSSTEKKENLGKVEGFDASKIQSTPFRKNPKTGVTLCAATAKFNAQKFGVTLPSGNAWDVSTAKPIENEYKVSLPVSKESKKPNRKWTPLSIADFDAMKGVNFADIYPDSKSSYGHRAVAFRDTNGEWMVLDPYIKIAGTSATDPKKLEEYMKVIPILKSHFYAVS